MTVSEEVMRSAPVGVGTDHRRKVAKFDLWRDVGQEDV
jgi:hypothetical protein